MADETIEEFLKRGGKIKRVPAGVRGLPIDPFDPEELTWVEGGDLTVRRKERIMNDDVDGGE